MFFVVDWSGWVPPFVWVGSVRARPSGFAVGACGCVWVGTLCTRKRGEEPLIVWFLSPLFFFCVERMAGVEPAAFALGGGALPVELHPRVAWPVRSFAFFGGVERMAGVEPAAFALGGGALPVELHPRVAWPVALARVGACLYSSRLRV